MSAALDTVPETAPSHGGTGGRDVNHIACCKHPELALCAMDIADHEWSRLAEINCRVCCDLSEGPCARVCPLLRKEP